MLLSLGIKYEFEGFGGQSKFGLLNKCIKQIKTLEDPVWNFDSMYFWQLFNAITQIEKGRLLPYIGQPLNV